MHGDFLMVVAVLASVFLTHSGGTETNKGHSNSQSPSDGTQACRYAPTSPWSYCDPVQGTKSKILTLTHGDPAQCPLTKVKTRVCQKFRKKRRKNKRKGCRYSRSEWSRCDGTTSRQEAQLTLRKGNPKVCPLSKTRTKRCHPTQRSPHHTGRASERLPAPQDLTVLHPDLSEPASIVLSWQPPRLSGMVLTSYVVEYSTGTARNSDDWTSIPVSSDSLSVKIERLRPGVTYLFRIMAVGPGGRGHRSPIVTFTSPPSP